MLREVIGQAREYLEALESQRDNRERADGAARGHAQRELPLFAAPAEPAADALREALSGLDPDELTPKAALEALYRLRRLLN